MDALVNELRTAAHLVRMLQPDQFDEVFTQAATVAARLTEGMMAGLLAARGTAPAMLDSLDVVSAFIERIPDDAAALFLAGSLTTAGTASARLTDLLGQLVPDPGRRRAVTRPRIRRSPRARWRLAFSSGGPRFEQQLESYSDPSSCPTRTRASCTGRGAVAPSAVRAFDDPQERIDAWVGSVDDSAIRSLDLSLLTDLSRLESDAFRWRDVLAILRGHISGAAEAGDWEGAAVAAAAVARVASDTTDELRSPPALEVLQECARNWVGEEALARLTEGDPAYVEHCARLLTALGPASIPGLVRRWSVERDAAARERIEAVVVGLDRPGRDALLGTARDRRRRGPPGDDPRC